MSLTKFTENINVISQLPDSPSLPADQLKAKFDEAGSKIKEYMNNTLTPEIEQLVSTEKSILQGLINSLRTEIMNYITESDKAKYYVGKIILDTENINPATYLGFGTWEYWGSGKVPVGVDLEDDDFNIVEKTGGEKTHTLTVGEIPALVNEKQVERLTSYGEYVRTPKGIAQPHNNLQPYITCYMWKRVS